MTDETFEIFDVANQHFAVSCEPLSFKGVNITALEWSMNQGSSRKFKLLEAKRRPKIGVPNQMSPREALDAAYRQGAQA